MFSELPIFWHLFSLMNSDALLDLPGVWKGTKHQTTLLFVTSQSIFWKPANIGKKTFGIVLVWYIWEKFNDRLKEK